MTLKPPRRLLLGGVAVGIFTVAAVAPVLAASRAAPGGKGVEAGRYSVLRDDKDTNCMVTLNPGGYPIYENGVFVGAIGVGGGSPKTDDEIARVTVEEMGAMKPAAAKDAD